MFGLANKVSRSFVFFLTRVLTRSKQLGYQELTDRVIAEMLSLEPENVVEGTFYGFPPYAAFLIPSNYSLRC